MNGVDLSQFQFDYDLTWAVILLNAEGTVYARYGSHGRDGPMSAINLEGFRRTLERVLRAHARWPGNRDLFEGKRGPPPSFRRPEDIPSAVIRRLRSRSGREGCIHCHNIYDALHEIEIARGRYDPAKLWKYPLPENTGVALDPALGNRVLRVLADSPASRAGLRPGDEIVALGGQAIFSIADFQFVLHHLPEKARVEALVRRDGAERKLALELKPGWRRSDISWRGSMWAMPPSPGIWLEELGEEERSQRGIAKDRCALKVRGIFKPPARRGGLRVGDIITAFDGRTKRATPGEFHAYLRLTHYKPGSVLKLEVLRGNEKRELEIRFE